jgi:hypothetical protein
MLVLFTVELIRLTSTEVMSGRSITPSAKECLANTPVRKFLKLQEIHLWIFDLDMINTFNVRLLHLCLIMISLFSPTPMFPWPYVHTTSIGKKACQLDHINR